MIRSLSRWGWLLPVLLAGILYLRAIGGELVWDDVIYQNDELPAFHGVGDAFFMPAGIPQWSRNYYRPVVVSVFLAERSWFGPGATRGPHAAVVLLHVIATFFVWLLVRRLLRDREWGGLGAIAAAALFAAHPIHTEAVCWISGHPDVLGTVFALAAVLAALRFRDRGSRWALVLSPVLFLAAVLSKEVAVSLIAVVPLFLWLAPEGGEREGSRVPRRGKKTASGAGAPFPQWGWPVLAGLYAAALAAYVGLRAANHVNRVAGLPAGGLELVSRAGAALAYYLVKVVVPPPQSAYPLALPPAGVAIPVLAAAGLGIAAGVRMFRRGEPLLLLGIGWVLVTLAPSLTIAVGKISETPVAERYLYLPSVGACLLAGWAVATAWARPRLRPVAGGAALLAIAVFAWLTAARIGVWANDVTLWSDVARRDPPAGLPWLNLGQAYYRRGDDDRALACYDKALDRYANAEGRALAWNSIGVVFREKDPDRAADAFRNSIHERPQYATPYFNLGLIGLAACDRDWATSGNYDPAVLDSTRTAFTQAVRLNRYYTAAYLGLGRCESKIAVARSMAGDMPGVREALRDARGHLQTACRLDPRGPGGRDAAVLLGAVEKELNRLGN